nr:hypothetical protein [Candidatus Sigynarchaeota archaeon]
MLSDSVVAIMDAFKQFTMKNRKIFEDIGVDAEKLGFKAIGDTTVEGFRYGKVLKELATSKTFPASVIPASPKKETEFARSVDYQQVTKETVLKKMRMATLVPILIAATCYLVLMLFL